MAEFTVTVPPGPLTREGGGAYIRGLGEALREAGHGVHFAAAASGSAPGVVHVIDGAALAATPLELLAGAVGLIHHTTPLVTADAHDAMRAAERERLPLLRRIVATSEPVRDRLIAEFGAEPGRVAVVRPGVADAPRGPGSGGPDCVILSVGALVPRKGHAVLLRALARLFDLPWRLVIVGDAARNPAHAAELQAEAARLGVSDRVRLAGVLDEAALEAAWRGADMFALATEWEGYCAPVAEALRRGLPVAVTQGGAAAELVTPDAGLVVQPGDADQLSKAMRRVIFDIGLRTAMAEAAWRAGQALPDWPTQAAAFIAAVSA